MKMDRKRKTEEWRIVSAGYMNRVQHVDEKALLELNAFTNGGLSTLA